VFFVAQTGKKWYTLIIKKNSRREKEPPCGAFRRSLPCLKGGGPPYGGGGI